MAESQQTHPPVDCGELLSNMYPYLAGELMSVDSEQFAGHLDNCPDCYKTVDFHNQLRTVIARKAREPELPQAFWERLQNRMESELGDEFVEFKPAFVRAVEKLSGSLLHQPSAFEPSSPIQGASHFEQPSVFEADSPFEQPSPFDRPSPFRPGS